jgi:hypothetical protein
VLAQAPSQLTPLAPLVVSGCSALAIGGWLTSWLARRSLAAFAMVPALGSLLAILPFAGVVMYQSFGVAMVCLGLEYVLGEIWLPPAVTLLQVRCMPPHARHHTGRWLLTERAKPR